jgi:ribosomal protein S18 acetylase RimI-like enzyme
VSPTFDSEKADEAGRLRAGNRGEVQDFIALQERSTDRKLWGAIDSSENARREITEKTRLFLKTGHEIIGSVAYRIRPDRSAYISNVIVDPAFRRNGLARCAVVFVLEQNKNAPRVDLVTHPDNEPALRLYRSLGFTIEARTENYFGDGEPRLVLVRGAASLD